MTVIDPNPLESAGELRENDPPNVWGDPPAPHGVVGEHPDMFDADPDAGVGAGDDDALGVEDVNRPTATARTSHVVEHVVDTIEHGADQIRGRVVRVPANTETVSLLDENMNRTRALIKVVTSSAVVMVQQARQGGNPRLTATPVGPQAAFPIATGDPVLEVKATCGVEAYGVIAAPGFVDVAIWEELENPNHSSGIT